MAMAKDTVTDEPAGRPEKDSGEGSWLSGYEASSMDSANAPDYPGNQVWSGPASSAEAYKAHWKNKPRIFPYGTNSQGGK